MTTRKSVGTYLLERLRALGVRRIYGVPGDYNLEFLELIERTDGISFIGNCNELNAAYAADGDARLSGISAVLTTYGVGDLSALSAIAGAYAEGVPVIMISGVPPLHAITQRALLHHTLADGNYENVMNCYSQFTVAQTRLLPQDAATEIDRVLGAAWREKRPVYLQLPSDTCCVSVQVPATQDIACWYGSDPVQLQAAVADIMERLTHATRPVLLLDALVRRFDLRERVAELSRLLDIPFATLPTGKGALCETDPNYQGIYSGKASAPALYERVRTADCVIGFGVRFVDATSGYFSYAFDPAAFVNIQAFDTRCGGDVFMGVAAADLLDAIIAQVSERRATQQPPVSASPRPVVAPQPAVQDTPAWGQPAFWARIQTFLRQGDVVLADNGTSLVALTHMRLPARCHFVSQPIWAAIGYTLPALLGSLNACPDRRHLLFIGDGSFQMTAQELSSILRARHKPVIFVLNNRGYTIERMILGETAAYNDIANWDYAALPGVMGASDAAVCLRVNSMDELEAALKQAEDPQQLVFIELGFAPMDGPTGISAFGGVVRHYDYGAFDGR
ncbi:pyruvate decarboxylase [Novacetimonas maltaceti]|uniref:Indole-3-pyruvate decarboxylase n=1 Tax=Novacetimonas maltaceti TaxID=1203393 RepID=A0A2S3VY40_9PROT|nr:thiamine pyrophosphate-binding protein [Novacetimonas maltaceti]POF61529.1 Indole-3-pyruvate decarboxylase [Novacetimonas maltaceti]PYD59424.1 pyruvate decarboxylase [Novacetimonas maltaceti]